MVERAHGAGAAVGRVRAGQLGGGGGAEPGVDGVGVRADDVGGDGGEEFGVAVREDCGEGVGDGGVKKGGGGHHFHLGE